MIEDHIHLERHERILRAALEGAVAAAEGLPLSMVSQSRYASRSACGDAWEMGWQAVAERLVGPSLASQGISKECP